MYEVIGPYVRNLSLALAAAKLWRLSGGGKFAPVVHSNHTSFLMGLSIRNPIGLAAGIDRIGCLIDGTVKAGYGFSEVGSVTPKTLQRTLQHLGHARKAGVDITIGVNIRATPSEAEEAVILHYLTCLQKLLPVADYIVLNLVAFFSQERDFDVLALLGRLLRSAQYERELFHEKGGDRVPLAIKLPLSCGLPEDQVRSLELCRQTGMDGVIVVSPEGLDNDSVCGLLQSTKRVVKELDVISVGGVATTNHVITRMEAGAAAVQIFSSVLKQGLFVPQELLKDLPPHQSELIV